jgi:hypothetical protein
MTIADIKGTISDFKNSTKNVVAAGFDGVELHAATCLFTANASSKYPYGMNMVVVSKRFTRSIPVADAQRVHELPVHAASMAAHSQPKPRYSCLPYLTAPGCQVLISAPDD